MAHVRFTQLFWEAVFLEHRVFLCQLFISSGNNASSCDECFDSQSTGPAMLKFSLMVMYQLLLSVAGVRLQLCWSARTQLATELTAQWQNNIQDFIFCIRSVHLRILSHNLYFLVASVCACMCFNFYFL